MTRDVMLYIMLLKSINLKTLLLIGILGGASSLFGMILDLPDAIYKVGEIAGVPALVAVFYIVYNFWNAKRKFRMDEFELTTKKLNEILDRESKEKDDLMAQLARLQGEYNKVFKELLGERESTLQLRGEMQKLKLENDRMRIELDSLKKELTNLKNGI